MKTLGNLVLVSAFVMSVIFIFGEGFAVPPISDFALMLLIIIAVCSIQLLACRMGKHGIVKSLPVIGTTGLALWGIWLYMTAPGWHGATPMDWLLDYGLPAVVCWMVWSVFAWRQKSHDKGACFSQK